MHPGRVCYAGAPGVPPQQLPPAPPGAVCGGGAATEGGGGGGPIRHVSAEVAEHGFGRPLTALVTPRACTAPSAVLSGVLPVSRALCGGELYEQLAALQGGGEVEAAAMSSAAAAVRAALGDGFVREQSHALCAAMGLRSAGEVDAALRT